MASVHRNLVRGNEHSVPSTEIVRNFPLWQERSGKRPVYILHHGRPRSVLLSLDYYGALLAAQGSQDEREARLRGQLDIVLACMETMFVQLGPDLHVVRINHAASVLLGRNAAEIAGQCLADVFSADMARQMDKIARKVLKTGLAEQLSLIWQERKGQYTFNVVPFPSGVAIFWTEVTLDTELAGLRAREAGQEQLLAMMTGCAIGEIRPDGMLSAVHPSLKRLLRFREDVIARTPFADLFADESRRKCRLHVAHVREGKGPVCCRLEIVTRDRDAVPIRLFLTPRMDGETVSGVMFSILDDALGALPMR